MRTLDGRNGRLSSTASTPPLRLPRPLQGFLISRMKFAWPIQNSLGRLMNLSSLFTRTGLSSEIDNQTSVDLPPRQQVNRKGGGIPIQQTSPIPSISTEFPLILNTDL